VRPARATPDRPTASTSPSSSASSCDDGGDDGSSGGGSGGGDRGGETKNRQAGVEKMQKPWRAGRFVGGQYAAMNAYYIYL